MNAVYHKTRTRPQTWVPRRVYYVLAYLKRQLTPDKPKAISNKTIQEAIRFGSEGEVSQIMRWLSGELPTMGRWAYGVLRDNAQRYRFIDRERMPSGGYLIRLLPQPEPLAPAAGAPQIVQLSLFGDDPSMIPPAPLPDAETRGSFYDMAPDRPDPQHLNAPNARSQRDHAKETHEDQQQQPSLALENSLLYQRLISDPDMNESLAIRVVQNAPGALADFLADLATVPSSAHTPLIWLASIWATGKRPKPRNKAPRHTPEGRAVPADNRPVPAYFERGARPNALSPEQIRAKLASMPRPDWTVKAGPR